MHPYPHQYIASAVAANEGPVTLQSPDLPQISSAPPPQFDGPGGAWSPETLLCAALADCFVLTFRALARTARLEWFDLDCRVEGLLERVERVAQFTKYHTTATLTVPAQTDVARARQLLERAEQLCLISNSLRGTRELRSSVVVREH